MEDNIQKNVYYSKNNGAQSSSVKNTGSFPVASVQVSSQGKKARKTGGLIMVLCMVFAVIVAVGGPLLVGGASTVVAAENVSAASVSVERNVNSYSSFDAAAQELGYTPSLPSLPANSSLVDARVVDGTMLEMEYKVNGATLLYRTEKGDADLSDLTSKNSYTTTIEDADGVTRMYSGATEAKVSLAVWTESDQAYTLQSSSNMDFATLQEIAQSINQ